MEKPQKLTKKEKKELRKQEWQEKAELEKRNAKIKKYGIWAAAVIIIIAVVGGLLAVVNSPSSTSNTVTVAPVTSRDITNGDKNAKLTLIEYADFQCPACGAYHPLIDQLLKDYNGKIFYIYRMFPLVNLHPNAFVAAQAGYAAWKQGKFFQMDDLLYNNQDAWAGVSDPRSIFVSYAKQLKMNVSLFETDMNSNAAKTYVQDSENEAMSEGINATPTFILNGVEIQNPNSYSDFKKLIDTQLSQK
jgi:protein-disulfide isomerase